MAKLYDLSKPLVALDHDTTLVCVIEMSGTSWLVAATVPGVDRRPLQKLPVNPDRLLDSSSVGARRRRGPDGQSRARWWRMNPDVMGSGWPGCCKTMGLRFMSFTPAASPYRVSSAGPRPTGSTPRC